MQKMGNNLPELEELKLNNIGGYYTFNDMASDVVLTTMPRFFFLGFLCMRVLPYIHLINTSFHQCTVAPQKHTTCHAPHARHAIDLHDMRLTCTIFD